MRACPAISPAANGLPNLNKRLIFRDVCGLYAYKVYVAESRKDAKNRLKLIDSGYFPCLYFGPH
jgi:hypothetical protein